MMSGKLLSILVVVLFSFMTVNGQNYASVIKEQVKKLVLNEEYKHYQIITYPTNNFGLMTIFVMNRAKARPRERDRWCATYSCLRYSRIPDDESELLKLGGFADVGQGGEISMTAEEKKQFELAIVGKVLSFLNLKTSFDRKKDIAVDLKGLRAWKRTVNKEKLFAYLTTDPNTHPAIKKAYDERRLAVVMGDVVLSPFEVTIKVTTTANAQLGAELAKKEGVFDVGSGFQVKFSRSEGGMYHLKVGQPVIVAMRTENQKEPLLDPSFGFGGESGNWHWTPTNVRLATQRKKISRRR